MEKKTKYKAILYSRVSTVHVTRRNADGQRRHGVDKRLDQSRAFYRPPRYGIKARQRRDRRIHQLFQRAETGLFTGLSDAEAV